MDLEIKVDENSKEPKILLTTPYLDENIDRLIKILKSNCLFNSTHLNAFKDSNLYIIDTSEIETLYSYDNKVYARTINNEIYTIKYKLYQLEEILKFTSFIRISNSEIVNFDKVEKLNLKFTGTILLTFKSKNETEAYYIGGENAYYEIMSIQNLKSMFIAMPLAGFIYGQTVLVLLHMANYFEKFDKNATCKALILSTIKRMIITTIGFVLKIFLAASLTKVLIASEVIHILTITNYVFVLIVLAIISIVTQRIEVIKINKKLSE